jgi:type IV pilus assembly protein PilO
MFTKISKIPFKYRIIFEIFVIALTIGLIYYFGYNPKKEKINKLQADVDRLSLKVSQLKPVKRSYAKFKAEFELLNKQFQTVLKILPNEKSYNIIYDEIVGLAERNGVKVTLFQPKGEKNIDSFHSSVNFKIKMETTYIELINYLYRLNYVNRIVNLNSFNIKPKVDKTGEITLRIDSDLNSYRFNVPNYKRGGNK